MLQFRISVTFDGQMQSRSSQKLAKLHSTAAALFSLPRPDQQQQRQQADMCCKCASDAIEFCGRGDEIVECAD